MVAIEESTDTYSLSVSVSRSEDRIFITAEFENISDEVLRFPQTNPKWCSIFLYNSEDEPCLEQEMVAAAYETHRLEPGEKLQKVRKTDTKEDWTGLLEELSLDLDECRYVTLSSKNEDAEYTVVVKILLDLNTPKMHLKFTPNELPYKDV